LSTRLLNHYCTGCTELEIENRKEMIRKRDKFRDDSEKQIEVLVLNILIYMCVP